MTEPVGLAPHVVEEVVARAGRADFERWAEQVERCGYCARPVRLRGRIVEQTGRGRREVYSTDREPDRVLLVRCRNRRASVCPSCSYEYAGDMWQLLYAGAAGGRKGVPESVRAHPLVFATLTAPGFGPVHTTRTDRLGGRGRCRPPRGKPTLCAHGGSRRASWSTGGSWRRSGPGSRACAPSGADLRTRHPRRAASRSPRSCARALSRRFRRAPQPPAYGRRGRSPRRSWSRTWRCTPQPVRGSARRPSRR